MVMKLRNVAVSLVEKNSVAFNGGPDEDGNDKGYGCVLLCVWSRKYDGWILPGGIVDALELIEEAQSRELYEETCLMTEASELMYKAVWEPMKEGEESFVVHVYRAITNGEPREGELGCPTIWLSHKDFLRLTPFHVFYKKMFEKV